MQQKIDAALASPTLETALTRALPTFRQRREAGMRTTDFEGLQADLVRRKRAAIAALPALIERFTASATRNGAIVHSATTPDEARAIIGRLARERQARLIVKGKSMVTEEIDLNAYLEGQGVKVIETDLGEWIVQLAGEHPSHILAPALHKTREQIAELLQRATGEPADPDDIEGMVKIARRALRQSFIDADIGITGVNFAMADSGTIAIVTNEGNDRLVATLPPVHIAIMGVEKIVADLDDANAILKLLSRSATGQQQSVYVSYITGPSRTADIELSLTIGVHGPRELHIILLDNGRLAMRDDPEFAEALQCIRCAACANVCPAYQAVGAVFGHVYTGPIGIMLTAFHHGLEHAAGPQSLCVSCNACETVCPAGIPLARQILTLRGRAVEREGLPAPKAAVMRRLADPAALDRWARRLAVLQRPFVRGRFVRRLPFKNEMVAWRSLPALAARPLRDRVTNLRLGAAGVPEAPLLPGSGARGTRVAYFAGCLTDRLYPEMGEAVLRVLRACGAEVSFPPEQSCCGLPALNSGDRPDGLTMARQTIAALERLEVDYILSASASCVVTLVQDYPHLFRDEPGWAARAANLAARVIDFTTFMDQVAALPAGALATGGESPTVTYHDACQSHNCLGLKAQPRRLLREVLGLEVREMQEPSFCCGFGGSFSLEHPDVSKRILGRKLRDIQGTGAAMVVADNPGCLMHLRGGVEANRLPVRVWHLAEVIAARLNDLERGRHPPA